MKKNVLFVAMAVFALATVSCGKKADTTSTPTVEVEEVVTTTETPADGDDLAQYEAFVDKYIAVLEKVQKGDMSAAQEMTTLATEAQDLQQKLATESTSWSKEKMEKYQTISQKLVDAVSNISK